MFLLSRLDLAQLTNNIAWPTDCLQSAANIYRNMSVLGRYDHQLLLALPIDATTFEYLFVRLEMPSVFVKLLVHRVCRNVY